nr:major royal jelly family protein [Candidatus Eremiobacteraeota bacterium]
DSGGQGALVVVNLQAGTARRLLAAHPSVQAEKDVVVHTDGHEVRRPDGRGVEFASDGIALAPAGDYLYWQALTGHTLYRIATAALRDTALSAHALAGRVERVGTTNVADGLWMTPEGRLYVSAPEENGVKVRESDGRMTLVVRDARLRWPDTFSQGPDGAMYVTASHIQDMDWYKPGNPKALTTQLFRIEGAH